MEIYIVPKQVTPSVKYCSFQGLLYLSCLVLSTMLSIFTTIFCLLYNCKTILTILNKQLYKHLQTNVSTMFHVPNLWGGGGSAGVIVSVTMDFSRVGSNVYRVG